jgi:hypothetical protein
VHTAEVGPVAGEIKHGSAKVAMLPEPRIAVSEDLNGLGYVIPVVAKVRPLVIDVIERIGASAG